MTDQREQPGCDPRSSALGLARGGLVLSPFRSEWEVCFQNEREGILEYIGPLVTRVEHVGSTAVHGMIAKPILDIGIAVEDFDEARACIAPLESRLGYTFMGERGIPRRHYFVKGEPRTHHIHMVEAHCEEWMRMIRFRDRLRDSPDLAGKYATLKLRLMRQLGADRKAYQEGKSDFIRSVIGQ